MATEGVVWCGVVCGVWCVVCGVWCVVWCGVGSEPLASAFYARRDARGGGVVGGGGLG